MKTKMIINPVYINLAELTSGNFKLGRLELSLDEWHEIPTTHNGEHGGKLGGLQLLPGKNIQIDVLYDGKIKPIDNVNVYRKMSYLPQNHVFHSEFLGDVKRSCHYRFQTLYPSLKFRPGSLSEAVKFTKSDATISKRQAEVSSSLLKIIVDGRDDLELILHDLLLFVKEKANYNVNEKDDYYDFSARYKEFETTGSFSGHCKEISTVTTGLINALGLRSKIVSAFIYELVGNQYEPRTLHSYSEAYVPLSTESGFWLLIDPSLDNLYNSKQLGVNDIYALEAELPKFLGTSRSAKIKIKYV